MQWKKDGGNFVTLYKYDTYYRLSNVYYNYTGSLSTIVYPQTADVTYSYLNGTSMKSSMVDSSGTSSYGYDYKDRLISYTPPKPSGHGAVSYTYNALGQKTSVTNGSFIVNYSYFANGWLRDVRRGTSTVADYVYDQVGNRTRINYGNGTYQTYTYNPADPRYQLDKIDYAYRCAAGQPIAVQGSIGLTRDNSGNPLTWSALDMSTPQKNIYSKAYSYDQMSRLDSANYPGKGTTDFQYDWVGNRINPGNMEYNASDQLTRWPNQHRYEYDGRGNLIYEKYDSGTTQKTYAYTYSNLTSSITYAGVNRSSLMTWDAAGNRITFQSSTRANDSDTYTFVYDPTAGIPAVIEEVTPTGTNRYIREPGGALIAQVATVGETETTHYYHFDELGSTQQPYQYVGKYGYYTHTQDSNLKMMQLGVRLYDAEIGRFAQRDILRHGVNNYIYSENNSTHYIDPSGKYPAMACRMPWSCYRIALEERANGDKFPHNHSGTPFGGDKLVHCVTACMIGLRANITCAMLAASMTERDTPFSPLQPGGDPKDEKANFDGVGCASKIRANFTYFEVNLDWVTGNNWLDCMTCCHKKGYRRWD